MQTKMLNNLKVIFDNKSIPVQITKKKTGVSIVDEKKDIIFDSKLSKQKFFEIIDYLSKAEQGSEKVFEIGIDLSEFESLYLEVIHILLSTMFNSRQMNLIHFYLYGETLDEDYELLPIYLDGKEVMLDKPEELWNAIQQSN